MRSAQTRDSSCGRVLAHTIGKHNMVIMGGTQLLEVKGTQRTFVL